mmetsp:Transcript_32772/g.82609  ORF Transcript_32772/g.82609 Transcript_32772/m.82609 type:complete len:147 (+) Transcript_32772:275-715(+)
MAGLFTPRRNELELLQGRLSPGGFVQSLFVFFFPLGVLMRKLVVGVVAAANLTVLVRAMVSSVTIVMICIVVSTVRVLVVVMVMVMMMVVVMLAFFLLVVRGVCVVVTESLVEGLLIVLVVLVGGCVDEVIVRHPCRPCRRRRLGA